MGIRGRNIYRGKANYLDGNLIEQMSNFIYFGNMIPELKKYIDINLQRRNKINDIIEINIGTQMLIYKKYAYITSHQEEL
jgi:hypothetical protein